MTSPSFAAMATFTRDSTLSAVNCTVAIRRRLRWSRTTSIGADAAADAAVAAFAATLALKEGRSEGSQQGKQ